MTPHRLTEADQQTLDALSDLCLRSKAHWGYDVDFIEACREVLRVKPEHLSEPTAVTQVQGHYTGIVRLDLSSGRPAISKLFVCPDHMGQGIGTALINWAKAEARAAGIASVEIESDPQALPFYARHGAVQIGDIPSEAIPGRMLPLLKMPTAVA